MKKIYFLMLFCFLSMHVHAQLEVSAGFSADTILIGTPVDYTISIKQNNAMKVSRIHTSALDSIFSAVQTQMVAQQDTTVQPDPVVSDYWINNFGLWQNDNKDAYFESHEIDFDSTSLGTEVLLENTINITFWDPGPQIIRHPIIDFQFGDSTYQYPYSGTAQIFVAPPFDLSELESDSIDVATIKPIIKEHKNITDYYLWFVLAFAIFLFAGIGYLLKRYYRKKELEPVKEVVIIRPAHEIAIEKLHNLKEEQLWQKGEIKSYQSKLTYTIREYLENRFNIKALESTTDEIAKDLNVQEIEQEDTRVLKEILQVADLVKFAKAKPDESVHESFLNKAFDFVKRTKKNKIDEVDDVTSHDVESV